MSSYRRIVVLAALGVVTVACGASTEPTALDATTSPSSAEVPVASQPPPDPLTEDPEPDSTTAPSPGLAFEDDTLPEGPVCDWLQSATFESDGVWVHLDVGERVEVSVDDWVDTTAASCSGDTIVPGPDDYDYQLALRVEDGELLLESGDGTWSGPLAAVDVVTVDEATAQPPIDADLQGAYNVGVQAIESYLDGDAPGFEQLLGDEILLLEDLQTTFLRDELMEFALDGGFPFGKNYDEYEMSDYLTTYEPVVIPLDERGDVTVRALDEHLPGATVVWFDGTATKSDRSGFLWDDLLVFAIATNGNGWQIVGM